MRVTEVHLILLLLSMLVVVVAVCQLSARAATLPAADGACAKDVRSGGVKG